MTEEQKPGLVKLSPQEAEAMKAMVNRYIERQDKINQILSKSDFLLIDIQQEQIISKRAKVSPVEDFILLCRILPRLIGAAEGMGAVVPDAVKDSFSSFVQIFNDNKDAIVIPAPQAPEMP